MLKKIIKLLCQTFPYNLALKIHSLSLYRHHYNFLQNINVFKERSELYKNFFNKFLYKNIFLIEFGVFKGNSIKEFTRLNKNKHSLFLVLIHLLACQRTGIFIRKEHLMLMV